jgi:hypothetical protein
MSRGAVPRPTKCATTRKFVGENQITVCISLDNSIAQQPKRTHHPNDVFAGRTTVEGSWKQHGVKDTQHGQQENHVRITESGGKGKQQEQY